MRNVAFAGSPQKLSAVKFDLQCPSHFHEKQWKGGKVDSDKEGQEVFSFSIDLTTGQYTQRWDPSAGYEPTKIEEVTDSRIVLRHEERGSDDSHSSVLLDEHIDRVAGYYSYTYDTRFGFGSAMAAESDSRGGKCFKARFTPFTARAF